jgi:hypothetical protein
VTIPSTGLRLVPIAQGILDDVADYFTANAVELPTRRCIAPGAPGLIAWDCEQVVVALASVTWGIGEDAAQSVPQVGVAAGVMEVRYAQWSVQIVRCTPQMDEEGNPPPVETIQLAGEQALADAGILSQFLVHCVAFPQLHEWVPAGALAKAGNVVSLGPSGPHHGFEGSLSVTATELT